MEFSNRIYEGIDKVGEVDMLETIEIKLFVKDWLFNPNERYLCSKCMSHQLLLHR